MEPSSDICAEEAATEGPSEQSLVEAGKDAAETDAGLPQEPPASSSFREVQELIQVFLTFAQI